MENENEQTNNELKVKIELSNQSSNKEFEFINNQNPETTIHANENTVIKIQEVKFHTKFQKGFILLKVLYERNQI